MLPLDGASGLKEFPRRQITTRELLLVPLEGAFALQSARSHEGDKKRYERCQFNFCFIVASKSSNEDLLSRRLNCDR
jgi:hypothetical protein